MATTSQYQLQQNLKFAKPQQGATTVPDVKAKINKMVPKSYNSHEKTQTEKSVALNLNVSKQTNKIVALDSIELNN